MTMQPGGLREPITIERKTRVADGFGGYIEAWSTAYSVWAQVSAIRGSEIMQEGRMVAQSLAAFTIWKIADLSELDRIRWNGHVWNIRTLPPSDDPLFQWVEAEKGVAS